MRTTILSGLFLMLLLTAGVLGGVALGPVTADDYARIPLVTLNDNGLDAGPDSFHVIVWYEGETSANSASYSFRTSAVSGTSSIVDTLVIGGYTYWYFFDLIDDIDGGEGNGLYCGDVVCWADDEASHNRFSFTKISQALDFTYDSLLEIGDAVAAALDTLQSHDDWVARSDLQTGLDSAQVARAVWNTPSANHTVDGSFGKYLDAEISGIGTGSGAFATTLVTADIDGPQTVTGVSLAVRNLDQSSLIATGRTGLDGVLALNLDPGDYVVAAVAPGYVFATDTVTITQTQSDTLWAERFDPGSPALPALCRVYGYLYSASGLPEPDVSISARLPGGVSRQGLLVVSPAQVETTTDANGFFYLDLIPSALLDNAPEYEVCIDRTDGTILRKRLAVPGLSSWQIDW